MDKIIELSDKIDNIANINEKIKLLKTLNEMIEIEKKNLNSINNTSHIKTKIPIKYKKMSIDELEKLTNLDFFPELQDDLEARLEKNSSVNSWDWKIVSTHSSAKKSSNSTGNSDAIQCSGTTKKGLRCKNRTKNSSGRCYLHE